MGQKELDKWIGRKIPKLTLDKLESFLWSAADILGGVSIPIFINITLVNLKIKS